MNNNFTILNLVNVLVIVVPMLLAVAFMTIIERKQLAAHQRRVGPQVTGYFGILQPFADALKLILKENVVPTHANKVLFFVAPISTLILSLLGWAIIPFGQGICLTDFNLGILYTLALSSLGVTGISNLVFTLKKISLVPALPYLALNINGSGFVNEQLCLKNTAIVNPNFRLGYQLRKYSTNIFTLPNLNNTTSNIIGPVSNLERFAEKVKIEEEEFAHWFSGFCDAESYFYIGDNKTSFSFVFGIRLHIDDIKVLQHISNKLKIGKIYKEKNIAIFRVNNFEELQIIFNILEIKSLNTTKYLNFSVFKECSILYYNHYIPSKGWNLSLTERSLLLNKIRELKKTMNTLRTNFILPESHKILITPYWLLGFVEGDGSFSVSTYDSFPLRFNIVQSITEKNVLEAIKLFLLDMLVNYKKKTIKGNPVQIIEEKESNRSQNRKLKLNLNINDHFILSKILVPFFDNLRFLTKKELDFKDWKNILELKTQGWHLSKEGANLIMEISKNMNNYRLSTYNLANDPTLNNKETELKPVLNFEHLDIKNKILLEKVNYLLSRPSNFELTPNGKNFIKSEQKFFKGRGNVEIEVFDKKGVLINSFGNMESAANFFNVKKHIVKYRLDTGSPLILNDTCEIKEVYFKRSINTLI